MAPPARKSTTEQKQNQRSAGVIKPKRGPSEKQVKDKWTAQDESAKRAQTRMKSQEDKDELTRLDAEIAELEKRPDSPEKEILLAGALARKRNIDGKSREASPADDVTISRAEDLEMIDDETNLGGGSKRVKNEGRRDEQNEINRKDAQISVEGKISGLDETDSLTEKVIHDVPWYIRDGSPIENISNNGQSVPIGYRKKGSGRMYLVRYGTAGNCSTRFESSPTSLPENPETSLMDVACRKNRIIEKIIAWHKDNGQPLPNDVLSKAQILNVYWDTKTTLGADVEKELHQSLGPKPPSRTSVRCVVYLDPKLYEGKWGVDNSTGLSHETRTTMLSCINGISREDREVEFFNAAVKLENRYQRRFQPAQTSLRPYATQPSVKLNTPRRVSSRRTPVRQPVCGEGYDRVFEESDIEDGDFEEPEVNYPRKEQSSKSSRQETPPITEDALSCILKGFATDLESRIMRHLQDTLVDQITEKVLEKIRKQG